MSRKLFKKIYLKANKALGSITGYQLHRTNKVDLDIANFLHDPREASYHRLNCPFFMFLKVSQGGNWLYSKFESPSSCVYFNATHKALNLLGDDLFYDAVKKEINRYREKVKIINPNELLGLEANESQFDIDSKPFEMVLPWDNRQPKTVANSIYSNISKENERYGLKTDEVLTHYNCSINKVNIETQRLSSLIESIVNKGYEFDEMDPIIVDILTHGDQYVWRVIGGQHRAAVLAALGYKKVLVRINKIIRREESSFWPAVKSGYYNERSALKVFDRCFHGKPPGAFGDYLS